MPGDGIRTYWDSCVFLSYLNRNLGWWPDLDAILAEVRDSDGMRKIVTSRLSQVEVVYVVAEHGSLKLHPDSPYLIDALMTNWKRIEFVELQDDIARRARQFIWQARQQGLGRFSPPDAIHLATAQWLEQWQTIEAFHTYNIDDYAKFASMVPFPICHPRVQQPRLL